MEQRSAGRHEWGVGTVKLLVAWSKAQLESPRALESGFGVIDHSFKQSDETGRGPNSRGPRSCPQPSGFPQVR